MKPEFHEFVPFGNIRLLVVVENMVFYKKLNIGLQHKQIGMGRDEMVVVDGVIVGRHVLADSSPTLDVTDKLLRCSSRIGGNGPASVGLDRAKCDVYIVCRFSVLRRRLGIVVGISADHLARKLSGHGIHKPDQWSRLALLLLLNFEAGVALAGIAVVILRHRPINLGRIDCHPLL